DSATETYDPDGPTGPSPSRVVKTYRAWAQKVWNGEVVYINNNNVCQVDQSTAAAKTNPPSFLVKTVSDCANPTTTVLGTVTWIWSGGSFGGAGCSGFTADVPLRPCDQTSPTQLSLVADFLRPELALNGDGTPTGYAETTDGTGVMTATGTPAHAGITANGSTPISQSIDDIKCIFTVLWGLPLPAGCPATSAGAIGAGVTPIMNHINPKERTILLFVTDADHNCSPFVLGSSAVGSPYVPTTMIQDDGAALGAAAAAQKLYAPLSGSVNADGTINGDPYSSVQTYLIAFGNGASQARSNWIAWGGSGMQQNPGTFGGKDTWTSIPTQAQRDACKTCVDAYLVPDAATLR